MPQTRSAPIASSTLNDTARALLASDVSPWGSLYMPADRMRNRIQLRPLLGHLRKDASLLDEGVEGVALFLTADEEQRVLLKLPFAPSLSGQLDDRVHVRPLWPDLEPDGRFYVLSIWGGGIKLYRASRYYMDVVSPHELPDDSLHDILLADDHIQRVLDIPKTSPTSTDGSAPRPVLYRNQEDIRQNGTLKEGLLRFFRRVDDRLRPMFGQEGPFPPDPCSWPPSKDASIPSSSRKNQRSGVPITKPPIRSTPMRSARPGTLSF